MFHLRDPEYKQSGSRKYSLYLMSTHVPDTEIDSCPSDNKFTVIILIYIVKKK